MMLTALSFFALQLRARIAELQEQARNQNVSHLESMRRKTDQIRDAQDSEAKALRESRRLERELTDVTFCFFIHIFC
jgi:hypothetical protein